MHPFLCADALPGRSVLLKESAQDRFQVYLISMMQI
jgi:hypothetical protein